METIFKLFVSTVCLWSVTGLPRKLSDSETSGLQQKQYESKQMFFSPDSTRNIVGSRFRQFQEESDWTNQLVEKSDKWNTRQKRAVRRNEKVPKGEEIQNQSQTKGNSRRHGTANRKETQRRNHPKKNRSNTLPEHENDLKQPLRQILILGTKQADKQSTKIKSIGPSGSKRKAPKRSRKGSFSIVPAKPKPKPRRFPIRRGWRSRLRSRAMARAMAKSRARSSSRTPKPKRIIRKTVRRGFVVLD